MTHPLTIPHLALAAAERWPHGEAVVDGERRASFSQLSDLMQTASAAFVKAGLQPGERVGVWAPNGLDWIVACLGLQAAGGVLVPLNTRFRGEEVADILRRSSAVMLLVIDRFLGQDYPAMLAGEDLPALRKVVRIGADGPEGLEAFLQAGDEADRAQAAERLAQLSADDVCDIMYTSGTTGAPKGAVTTHGQTVRTATAWTRATTLGLGDRFLILWPFFHCSGYKSGWVACLVVGAATLPLATLDIEVLLGLVEREKVTFLPGPPTLFLSLLADSALDPARLASLRVSVTGAAAVAPSLVDDMHSKLGVATVLTGYGLTETCGTVTMTSPEDAPAIIATSCGRPIEGLEVRIVGETGEQVLTGEPGEVLVRGMNVMQGYLDDPAATAAAIDADGWLHTGDIGVLDAAGYLRITDRKKDMYISGGFNCYPAELEKLLLRHPAVAQVAVVGVPDARLGEVGKAFVVLKPAAAVGEADLIEWTRSRIANFKVPRHVAFVDQLPTNATGKVQKFRLTS